MIQLSNLTKSFGDRVLLDDVMWQITDRERVGLCGPNGAGKTTLLRMMAGLDEPDSGAILKPGAVTVGYLPQDGLSHAGRTVFEEASSAFDALLAMKTEMHALEARLGDPSIPESEHEARNWLETYLNAYPYAVILVSHDRFFLDAVVTRIADLTLRTLTDYVGNYSHYLVEHESRIEALRKAKREQDEEVARVKLFIDRFRYQATKAAQVQSRIKMLEKVVLIEVPPERKTIHFDFPPCAKSGRTVLELKHARKTYGDLRVLSDVNLHIERGDRIALVGPNGVGKSTLMRLLSGEEAPDSGQCSVGHNVVMQYFAQDEATRIDPVPTVYETLASGSPLQMVPMIRNILGGFLFSGDDVYKHVRVLSGGERTRLAVARMLLRPSNTLLLDEPTNHLDLDSKEVLLDALVDYGGTLIFVSHDRYFVERLATKIIEVGHGGALVYPGTKKEFLWHKEPPAGQDRPPLPTKERKPVVHLKAAPAAPKPAAGATSPPRAHTPKAAPAKADAGRPAPSKDAAQALSYDPLAPRLRPTGAPPDRQAREREARKAKVRLAELERQIGEKEQAVKDLEHLMATPGFYDDRAAADRSVAERQQLLGEVETLMSEWESLQTAAEAKG